MKKFCLENDYTDNPNIWVGLGRIGGLGNLNVEEAKKFMEKIRR